MNRSTSRLTALQEKAREPFIAMDARELGTARATRHSFSRALTRTAVAGKWKFSRRMWDIDDLGNGIAVYRVDIDDRPVELVLFSHVIPEDSRNDRVIAQDWDVTAALVDHEASSDEIEALSDHVTKQEDGRADAVSLIWGRANRSARYFDYVVNRLAAGQQPEPHEMSDAAYIMRSTAFYSNGKWGLRDFAGIDSNSALATPYRAQMLAAWLFREFSADLAEHCAAAKSAIAVPLDPQWRRFLGLGNATGLGMVPYVIRHPQVLDAWVAVRELPLAQALTREWASDSPEWSHACTLLDRSVHYFEQKKSFTTEPYPTGPELAKYLAHVQAVAHEYATDATMSGNKVESPGKYLHELAARHSIELRQIVDSILVEIDDSLDAEIESLLRCVDRTQISPVMLVSELLEVITEHYEWAITIDFTAKEESAKFWFYSQDSEEPRRGTRGKDRGEITEHPVGVARDAKAAFLDLQRVDATITVGEFLVEHPQHWGIVERIQSVAHLPYSEARINPLAENFLPLDLQRFQLALYGMENYNPQSTDWLRVTLLSGAPTLKDLNEGVHVDDWLFLPRPENVA